jgi:hypothetical protein
LLAEKRVSPEPTSKHELDDLRKMVALNLHDARVAGISSQGRFEFAYNAARIMSTLVVRASGYRVTSKAGHHYYTFQALQAAGARFLKMAIYFDDAREKRNDFSYDAPVPVSDTDADELVRNVEQFRHEAEAWVKAQDPTLA